jgi:hypothetical protein
VTVDRYTVTRILDILGPGAKWDNGRVYFRYQCPKCPKMGLVWADFPHELPMRKVRWRILKFGFRADRLRYHRCAEGWM